MELVKSTSFDEQEIIKRAKYKSEGLTNEEIAKLLSPIPPSASEYKSFIGRYMEIFVNKFKSNKNWNEFT